MEKIFEEMFTKQPDEIIDGDYFYRVPWYEWEWSVSTLAEQYGMSEAEYLERMEKGSKTRFKSDWEKRTFQGEYDWLEAIKGENKDDRVEEIINRIAHENIPFMDIASSECMGLASYILKMNPKTPCLVTDIDAYAMKRLRSRVDENLSEYNISLASFDNLEMPLKDASIDYVTGFGGIGSSAIGKTVDRKIMSLDEFTAFNERKLLDEVYRVLKPGGCFITVESEMDWACDWQKIDTYFSEHEKLFGMYTYDVVRAKLEEFVEWKKKYAISDEKIIESGFKVEAEKRHCKKVKLDEVAQYFSPTGDRVSVKDCYRTEGIVNLYFYNVLYILRKPI